MFSAHEIVNAQEDKTHYIVKTSIKRNIWKDTFPKKIFDFYWVYERLLIYLHKWNVTQNGILLYINEGGYNEK